MKNWFKYRTCFSHGYQKWEYVLLDAKNIKEAAPYFENIADRYNWSEHWRGLDVEKIKPNRVPREILERAIESSKRTTESLLEDIKQEEIDCRQMEKQLKNCEWRIPRRKKCSSCKGKGFWERDTKTQSKIQCAYCDGTGYVKGE